MKPSSYAPVAPKNLAGADSQESLPGGEDAGLGGSAAGVQSYRSKDGAPSKPTISANSGQASAQRKHHGSQGNVLSYQRNK